jgi:hypothetical protein
MTAFEEVDARLGAMHGYAGGHIERCSRCGLEWAMPPSATQADVQRLEDKLERLEDKVNVLAVALDALITAMKGGAIGRWPTPPRPPAGP